MVQTGGVGKYNRRAHRPKAPRFSPYRNGQDHADRSFRPRRPSRKDDRCLFVLLRSPREQSEIEIVWIHRIPSGGARSGLAVCDMSISAILSLSSQLIIQVFAVGLPSFMQLPNLQFWREVLLAVFLAIISAFVAMFPPFDHFGGISLALIAGMLTKALFWKPSSGSDGLAFAGKTLLRIGIVLLGLRLNLAIVAHSGTQVVVFDLLMIILGITLIMFVLRRLGFETNLAILAAVGSSIF